MIILYAVANMFQGGVGETKDLRVQWALEETGLPYRVHALDYLGGEAKGEAYSRISPFHQIPVIEDDGFAVAETGAVLLYLAEKAGKLIPRDVQGRTSVVQWCFAAAATVGTILAGMDLVEIFDADKTAPKLHTEVRKLVDRFLGDLERRLQDRQWIATDDFTVADVMMANVLRSIRKTDLMNSLPKTKAYYDRCHARPAWERTLRLSAERLRVSVDEIR